MGVLARKLLAADAANPIEFVGSATTTKAGAASGNSTMSLTAGLSGGIASSVSDGDFVIAVFATGGVADRTLSITDGTNPYTLIGSELYADDTNDSNLRVCYKFVSGDTSVTFGPTGASGEPGLTGVYVFRNVNQTTPLDVSAVTATGTNSLNPNPPSITPVTSGAFIVAIGASGTRNTGQAFVTPSDLTAFVDNNREDTYGVAFGIGHKNDWSSGEFDPAAWVHDSVASTSYAWTAITVALRPA